ncbi:MAG: hypothetical protein GYB49_02890 [Alphaproteobacteria bacterium]|nr:hypothetical protein [Alphaproteobacteria bacterium]
MTALALKQAGPSARPPEGLARSARLMRALGPDAAPVWGELSSEEAHALSAAMDALDDDYGHEAEAVQTYVKAHTHYTPKPAAGSSVWARLSAMETADLLQLLGGQHPQTIALILSRMEGEAAARLLKVIRTRHAVDIMQRLLHIGPVNPIALKGLEAAVSGWLDNSLRPSIASGHERIARIFDQLDSQAEQNLLAALDSAEPGVGDRVRALMFTFDDLAKMDTAGLQTLLSSSDRAMLTLALKGAKPETATAFFRNMTQRAGSLLREEIAMLGPVRRSEVEAARRELVRLARALINQGDIRGGLPEDEDELVE